MGDRLRIHQLQVQCRLGVTEAERVSPQPVWIDLELSIDAAKAAARDDVDYAVDYAALVEAVKSLVEHTSYRLMETLGEDVAGLILKTCGVAEVRVQVIKRALPGIESAAIDLTRTAAARKPNDMSRRTATFPISGRR